MIVHSAQIELQEQRTFRSGLKAGISIAIGYLPIAITFGLLGKTTGLTFIEAVAMSIFVFAGAAQYIALNMIAVTTSAIEIIITTFIVNIRHLLMSMSINEKSVKDPILSKLFYSFGITDETFSVAMTQKNKITSGFMFGLIAISYGSWVVNTAVGYIIGSALPEVLKESMEIALFAMFIGLLVPAARKNMKYLLLAAFAAILNSSLTKFTTIDMGWAIVIATLFSALLVELVWKGEKTNE